MGVLACVMHKLDSRACCGAQHTHVGQSEAHVLRAVLVRARCHLRKGVDDDQRHAADRLDRRSELGHVALLHEVRRHNDHADVQILGRDAQILRQRLDTLAVTA